MGAILVLITILTAVITFIATGIDELFVLTIIFVCVKNNKAIRSVYIGQQIAMIVLLVISVLAVFGISIVTQKWVGILGLLPIIQGLGMLINGDEGDDKDEEVISKTRRYKSLTLSVAVIAIAGGGEELAIYIPYFASLSTSSLIVTLITFNALVPIWCMFCRKISSLKQIQEVVSKFERILLPIVFIGLGIFVLVDNNTISSIISLFNLN